MSVNPNLISSGVGVMLAISFVVFGANGSDTLEICYTQVATTCSHAEKPIPCANIGIDKCDQTPAASDVPVPRDARPKPNREIVLQSGK